MMANTGDGSNFLAAVYRELARARAKHNPMHSHHEAYAVLLEELDEVWDEVMLNDSDPYALGEKYRRELTAIAQRHAERKRAIDDMRTHREGGE